MSVYDHSTHTKGKVAEFLEGILPGKRHAVTTAYRVLFDEVRRKTTFEGDFLSFDELKLKKGISRSVMNSILEAMGATLDLSAIWEEVRGRLLHEGLSAWEVRRIGLAWELYEVKRMDPTNELLRELRKPLTLLCVDILSSNPTITLRNLMDAVHEIAEAQGLLGDYSREYFNAVVLMESYGAVQLS